MRATRNGRLVVDRVKKSAGEGRGLPSPGGRSFLSPPQKGTKKVTAQGTEAVVCPQCKTAALVLEASRNLQL